MLLFIFTNGNFKVYFVLGGLAQNRALLDSSEFYVEGDTKWTLFTGLNPTKYGFTSSSLVLDNRIFIIGKVYRYRVYRVSQKKRPHVLNSHNSHKNGTRNKSKVSFGICM